MFLPNKGKEDDEVKGFKKVYTILLCTIMVMSCIHTQTRQVYGQDTDFIYVSDVDWISASAGYGTVQKDTGLEGLPIRLRTEVNGTPVTYEKGITAHAVSKIAYDVEHRGYERFQAYIGVNYSKTQGSCGFRISADDEVIYQKDLIKESDAQVAVDVAIPENAKVLILETTDGGNGITADHSVWADAKFILDPEKREQLAYIDIVAGSTILKAGDQTDLNISAYKGNGALISEVDQIIYRSSDDRVASVDANGIVQAHQNGLVNITATATYQGITKDAELNLVIGNGDEQNSWALTSEDGSIHTVFSLIDGSLHYAVAKNGASVIEDSQLKLNTDAENFSQGLVFVKEEMENVTDEYTLKGAKVSEVSATGKQLTLTFQKNEAIFKLVARIYNDGMAFQYVIEMEDGAALAIKEEQSQFQLPYNAVAQAMDYISHHEAVAYEKLASELNGEYCMPLLYQTQAGTYVLISEAGLNPEYCGAILKGNGKGRVDAIFSPEQKGDVTTTAPFASPWRFVVIGDAATVNENTMAETLSPDQSIDDSWIVPGVTSWTWLNRESTSDYETYKRYVDFAAEMNWQYVLLDEGWQPKGASGSGKVYDGYYEWTYDLLEYAEAKGIGLLVWANNADLNTEAKREVISEWAEMGFKGVKPDFFNSQSQATMQYFDALAKKTAEHHMLLNIHGSNKTTGERRTYPHLLTREGVFGAEQDLFKPNEVSARHNCMLPFTRNAVGPADYTPMLSYRNAGSRRSFTVTHQAALATVYESGIQCFADRPEVYRASPAYLYFKDFPTSFAESRMLDGIPGEYVNIVRRSGDDWYGGIIVNEARNIEFDFSFLSDGEYYAMIYTDGEKPEDMKAEYRIVTKEDIMKFDLPATGGIAMKIMKEKPSEPVSITMSETAITLEQYDNLQLSAEIEPADVDFNQITWTSDDDTIASVVNGTVTGWKPGTTTIHAATGFGNQIVADCKVTVTMPAYSLTDDWYIQNEDYEKFSIQDEHKVTITTQPGEFYIGSASAKNVVLHDLEDQDFETTLKLDFVPEGDYQSAGLLIYANDTCLFGVLRRSHSSFGGPVISVVGLNGRSFFEKAMADAQPSQPVYLRIKKTGNQFYASYSYDQKTFTTFADVYTNDQLAQSDIKGGLYAVNGNNKQGNIPAVFENFTVSYGTEEIVYPFAKQNLDKTALQTLYDEVKDYEEKAYTKESWTAFKAALDQAAAILENENATAEQVTSAITALSEAKAGLVKAEDTTFIKKLLKNAMDKAESIIVSEDFVSLPPNVQAMIKVRLKEAAAVYEDDDATIDACRIAWVNLADALHYAEFKADKTMLKQLIDECIAIDTENFTEESVKYFQNALMEAKAVYEDQNALQDRINLAHDTLLAARDGLTEKPVITVDKSVLEYFIEAAKNVVAHQENYLKNAAWDAFIEALAAAEEVYADETATQAAVDEAAVALSNAYMNIRLIPDENMLKQLEDFLAYTSSIDRTLYTEQDLSIIDEAVKKAQDMLNSRDFDEAEFHAFTAIMKNVIERIDQNKITAPEDQQQPENGKEQDNGKTPDTSDATNMSGLYLLLLAGFITMIFIKKQKVKEEK